MAEEQSPESALIRVFPASASSDSSPASSQSTMGTVLRARRGKGKLVTATPKPAFNDVYTPAFAVNQPAGGYTQDGDEENLFAGDDWFD
jgi:hypothetical protein